MTFKATVTTKIYFVSSAKKTSSLDYIIHKWILTTWCSHMLYVQYMTLRINSLHGICPFFWPKGRILAQNCKFSNKNIPFLLKRAKMIKSIMINTVTSLGILKAKQELGVTFNLDKQDVIDLTKFSKMTMCRASEANSIKQS